MHSCGRGSLPLAGMGNTASHPLREQDVHVGTFTLTLNLPKPCSLERNLICLVNDKVFDYFTPCYTCVCAYARARARACVCVKTKFGKPYGHIKSESRTKVTGSTCSNFTATENSSSLHLTCKKECSWCTKKY